MVWLHETKGYVLYTCCRIMNLFVLKMFAKFNKNFQQKLWTIKNGKGRCLNNNWSSQLVPLQIFLFLLYYYYQKKSGILSFFTLTGFTLVVLIPLDKIHYLTIPWYVTIPSSWSKSIVSPPVSGYSITYKISTLL